MGRIGTFGSQSQRKQGWKLAVYSLLGLQVTGICWSEDKKTVIRGQSPTVTVGDSEAEAGGGVTQVGHKKCLDPNCDHCRPRWRRKFCPPEWYMQSPLWQSVTGEGTGAAQGAMQDSAAANQGLGTADMGGAGMGGDITAPPANAGFDQFAYANPSNLAPNIIGDLFGQNGFEVTGISKTEGSGVLTPNFNSVNGPITVISQLDSMGVPTDVIFAPLAVPGDINSGPGDVTQTGVQHQSGIIGSTTDIVLYKFTINGQLVAPDAVDANGNPVYGTIAATEDPNSPGNYLVNQFNTQAAAVARAGQLRIAENVSPMPRDRIFLNYSFFQDAQLSDTFNANVNRLTPGFEKTFMDGNASFELRAPFATSLDPVVTLGGVTNADKVAFGNLNMTAKFLLYRSDTFAFSTGLQVVAPTARDTRIQSTAPQAGNNDIGRIYNRSTHVMPYAGFLYTPDDRLFTQGFVQVDVDANGNPVYANDFLLSGTVPNNFDLMRVGTLQDTTSMYTSTSAGYWVYRADSGDDLVQAWAPVVELHTSTSLQRSDYIEQGLLAAGSKNRHTEVINMVVGMHTQLRNRRFLSVAYAFPISGSADRQFQGEFRLLLNQLFGPINRQTSAGFFGG